MLKYKDEEVLRKMEYRGFLNLSVLGKLIAVPIVITHNELNVDVEVIIKIEYKENTYLGTGKVSNGRMPLLIFKRLCRMA